MGVPPYPAITIAAWFISQAKAGEEEPSSQKVHTLIGRAQSHYRARYGRPLLAEPMPVWPPGGPVPSDEHAVKASGASPAGPGDNEVSTGPGVDLATASFLGEVWDSYGGCFAEVKLVIPAACRQLPVGGAA
jgi:uncharacterized phage-associated protein